jgi:hypothetical protein
MVSRIKLNPTQLNEGLKNERRAGIEMAMEKLLILQRVFSNDEVLSNLLFTQVSFRSS